jgi:hypothetical protein
MNNTVIKTVHSIRKLVDVLGIKSRRTIAHYINHIKSLYSPNLKGFVNIKYPFLEKESLLTHNIIYRKINNIPQLIIPNVSLFSLIPNKLYVYSSDLSLIKMYESTTEAVKDLNPNYKKLGIKLRGREVAISRGKNRNILIKNELGYFYFAENPKSNR